ncbi:hypothetical protein FRC03_011246 [Tulasnella sp. 419]|nr:hypothetical protein FRC02_007704 [Tulasnella sp. 418]KAG8955245.1 hypothetical protein FRC03_011246 [Tulasnella sp. 419]
MEIVTARSSLLSNFEVFQLLREQQLQQEAAASTEDNRTTPGTKTLEPSVQPLTHNEHVPAENQLRIQNETIAYLSSEPHPTLRHDPSSIKTLLENLRAFDLTKAEKLMIVNLAPSTNVELYTIVEELEDRLQDQVDEILEVVKASLSSQPVQVIRNVTRRNGTTQQPGDTEMNEDLIGEWAGEEQVYYDEGLGCHDDLAEEMDED